MTSTPHHAKYFAHDLTRHAPGTQKQWKVQLIEEAFHRLMFATEDV